MSHCPEERIQELLLLWKEYESKSILPEHLKNSKYEDTMDYLSKQKDQMSDSDNSELNHVMLRIGGLLNKRSQNDNLLLELAEQHIVNESSLALGYLLNLSEV